MEKLPEKYEVIVNSLSEFREVLTYFNLKNPVYEVEKCHLMYSPDRYPYFIGWTGDENSEWFYNEVSLMRDYGIATQLKFDQFEQQFLKPKDMRKLIGYKIKPEFESKRQIIATALGVASYDIRECFFTIEMELAIDLCKQLGVLSIWFDELYEPNITICGKNVYKSNGYYYINDVCGGFDFKDIKGQLFSKSYVKSIRFEIDGEIEDVTLDKINQILEL